MLQATSNILRQKNIATPTVIVDKDRALANIARMAEKARAAQAVFRPHFKTHQSAGVGRWFHDAGVRRITVSSLGMAEYFAEHGWHDITVAMLFNPLELSRAEGLARQLVGHGGRLGLVVDTPGVAAHLAEGLKAPTDIWLKIDTGYGRTGINWDNAPQLRDVLAACRGLMRPVGLLTHSGHSYAARGRQQITAVYDETVTRMNAARTHCGREGLQISLGDTPCCRAVDDLSACDEIRPGNFVFFDLMQLAIGSCEAKEMAAAIACPVVGVYPERQQVVIHAGAVHLSKESLPRPGGGVHYGCLGTVDDAGFGDVLTQAPLVSLSQEHGVIEIATEFDTLATGLSPGDLVLIWPVHSCLACDLLRPQLAAPLTI